MKPRQPRSYWIFFLLALKTLGCDTNDLSPGSTGLMEGVSAWTVPQTPNGLQSKQSWLSIGSAPNGDIYLGTSDHTTNSAVFRLAANDTLLRYIGDARSASEAANNWHQGEAAEKIHVRPLWYQNRVYVATAGASNLVDLKRRGFHWYAYDETTSEFLDLSKSEPMGVGAEHGSIFAMALDETRGVIYALDEPTSDLYQYNIATGTTVNLGRHTRLTQKFYSPSRFLWVDSRGRVYLSVTNATPPAAGEIPAPTNILYWDPVSGWGEEPSWTFSEGPRTGQWSRDKKYCYILTGSLELYLFDDEARSFQRINQGILPANRYSRRTRNIRVRTMNLSANQRKLYFANDTAAVISLYEWDWQNTDTPRELAHLTDLYSKLTEAYSATTGHDAWDNAGRFYITSFGGEDVGPTPDVVLLGVDPVRLKAKLKLIPGVPVLSLQRKNGISILRKGDLTIALEALLESDDGTKRTVVSLPAGVSETIVPESMQGVNWHILPDGDSYVTETSSLD